MTFRYGAFVSGRLSWWASVSAALLFAVASPSTQPSETGSGFVTGFQQVARVWVNSSSRVYHCPGSRYYGATKRGTYMTEADARSKGNRPAYGQTCAPLPSADGHALPLGDLPAKSSGVQVWVNTSSGVYHCPGSRYYRNTKHGQLMTEGAATASGKRPAHGKVCS